jgi:hypothetical protein
MKNQVARYYASQIENPTARRLALAAIEAHEAEDQSISAAGHASRQATNAKIEACLAWARRNHKGYKATFGLALLNVDFCRT